jgi:hypothetical protein
MLVTAKEYIHDEINPGVEVVMPTTRTDASISGRRAPETVYAIVTDRLWGIGTLSAETTIP